VRALIVVGEAMPEVSGISIRAITSTTETMQIADGNA
jgi:hypothetical protein